MTQFRQFVPDYKMQTENVIYSWRLKKIAKVTPMAKHRPQLGQHGRRKQASAFCWVTTKKLQVGSFKIQTCSLPFSSFDWSWKVLLCCEDKLASWLWEKDLLYCSTSWKPPKVTCSLRTWTSSQAPHLKRCQGVDNFLILLIVCRSIICDRT